MTAQVESDIKGRMKDLSLVQALSSQSKFD